MTPVDDRDVEDVNLGGVPTPRTIDPLAALVGGVLGGLFVVAVWVSSVPFQAVFAEGVLAGLGAGSVNENTKLPALDGAAAAAVGAVLGLVGICLWLVVTLSLSARLEFELFLSLFVPGLGFVILAIPVAAVPAAVVATLAYRIRRTLGRV